MNLRFDVNKTELTREEIATLRQMRTRCARRILLSTSLSASGHPGGSLSALDMLLVTYGLVKHNPAEPRDPERDRVVVSMGHISPGVYSVLAENGYFTEEQFLAGFRRTGSGFPGHVESIVPGVEWDTGNLGQGLSAAVGMAQAFKTKKMAGQVITLMGDGEHQKGQVVEAIRYARKFGLDNLTVMVDRNHLQICGDTEVVMPQSIRALYSGMGWNVIYLEDGHDYNAIYRALRQSYLNTDGKPTVIVARTIMSKGVSFMENQAKYHGSPLKPEQLAAALKELGVENDYEAYVEKRKRPVSGETIVDVRSKVPAVSPGEPILYDKNTMTDNRSAYGNALHGLAVAN
ncbi:MAG: transketolase, partial [Desulfobulbaceae bacterium]|nr:transketolase [Desulfobulbaceae bacterium]